MFYNPSYMNPIMKGLNQGQPQQQEPLEGIASLAPQQPTQPLPPSNTFIDDMRDKTLPTLQFPEGTGPLDPGGETIDPLRFNQITAPQQIPDRYKEGFVDFYKQNPDDFMRMGGQAISYVTTPQGETIQFGDTGSASNFREYLESIGETPKPDYGYLSVSTQPLVPDNNAFPASPGFTPLPMGQHPLMGNLPQPTEGVSQDVFGNPNILKSISNANFNVSPPGTLKLDPQADMPNMLGDPPQGIASLANYQSQQNTGPGI